MTYTSGYYVFSIPPNLIRKSRETVGNLYFSNMTSGRESLCSAWQCLNHRMFFKCSSWTDYRPVEFSYLFTVILFSFSCLLSVNFFFSFLLPFRYTFRYFFFHFLKRYNFFPRSILILYLSVIHCGRIKIMIVPFVYIHVIVH